MSGIERSEMNLEFLANLWEGLLFRLFNSCSPGFILTGHHSSNFLLISQIISWKHFATEPILTMAHSIH